MSFSGGSALIHHDSVGMPSRVNRSVAKVAVYETRVNRVPNCAIPCGLLVAGTEQMYVAQNTLVLTMQTRNKSLGRPSVSLYFF